MRKFVLAMLTVALVAGLFGCASPQPTPTSAPAPTAAPGVQPTVAPPTAVPPTAVPPTAAPKEKTKIVYWRSLASFRGEAQDELGRQFNASQDEVEVEVQFQGAYSELEQKFLAGIAARQVPDVVMLCDTCFPQFARSGALLDIQPLIDGPDGMDTSEFFGTLFKAGNVDGVQYWVPFATSTPIMMYNPDMFAKAGLSGPPKTWDEFFEYAKKLTIKEGNDIKQYGCSSGTIGWQWQSQVWSQGGQLSDENFNTFIDSPVWIEELSKWRKATNVDKSIVFPSSAEGGSLGYFSNGLAAMLFTSTANVSQVVSQAQGFKPMSAFMPGGKAGLIVPSGGSGLAIPALAPKETNAAAWKFIKFMVSPESNAYFSKMTGYMPMTAGTVKAMEAFLNEHPEQKVSIDQMAYARGQSELNASGRGNSEIQKIYERILIGNEDPAVLLPEAQKLIQQIFVEDGLKK